MNKVYFLALFIAIALIVLLFNLPITKTVEHFENFDTKIQMAVEKVMKDRTSIIIAHRLSTIKNVDKIIVIDKGRIVEMGSHKELLKKNNIYSKLSKMQNLS